MTHVVVLGAGIGGVPMAFELREQLGKGAKITVVSDTPWFQFVPSNPWVAVGWRKPSDIKLHLPEVFGRLGIGFSSAGAKRVIPAENAVELGDGTRLGYDYLVIATGPKLAFDEIEGLGPDRNSISICHVDHAEKAAEKWERFCADPGPVVIGAVQGASCFGPAYEFAMIVVTELRRRKLRHKVPLTFVTSEPYVGHLGLDGVGDTKGMLESAFRDRDVKWVTNARINKVNADSVSITEVNEDGSVKGEREIPSKLTMLLPAFRGIDALKGADGAWVPGLTNPRGFVAIDDRQRNPTHRNIFAVGVCVAIPPVGPTPVPVGVPKTGYMIESMVTAAAHNIADLVAGKEPSHQATWNALCLADFGDSGIAFVAMPQIPPRNVNWSSEGYWVHAAKVAFEKYFLRKIRKGTSEPAYERVVLKALGIDKLRPKASA